MLEHSRLCLCVFVSLCLYYYPAQEGAALKDDDDDRLHEMTMHENNKLETCQQHEAQKAGQRAKMRPRDIEDGNGGGGGGGGGGHRDAGTTGPQSTCSDDSTTDSVAFSWQAYLQSSKKTYPYYIVGSTAPNYPLLLPMFRLTCAAYLIVLYIVFIIFFSDQFEHFGMFFFFLTNLGVFALLCYFLLTGIESLRYAVNPRAYLERWMYFPANGQLQPREISRYYTTFLHGLYAITFPANFFIAVMYWGLVSWTYSEEFMQSLKFHDWVVNVSIHGLNFIFIFTDFLLSRQRLFLRRHFITYTSSSLFYIFWTHVGNWIYSTPEQEWYVYPIMENRSVLQRTALFVAVFLASILFYGISFFLHAFKEMHWPLCQAMDYILYWQLRQEKLAKLQLLSPDAAAAAAAAAKDVHRPTASVTSLILKSSDADENDSEVSRV